jgi:FAD synthetase
MILSQVQSPKLSLQVQRQCDTCDLVITSGGVGPTHDDVTIKAVAAAFGQEMVENPTMLQVIVEKFGQSDMRWVRVNPRAVQFL